MSGSLLTVEYEGLAGRHELYAKYGIAAETAQLFETEMGMLLLCLRALENDWHIVPNAPAAREVLVSIDRSTLGRLLNDLRRYSRIDGGLEDLFSSALNARNRLMHGFFEKHNFKIQTEEGRTEMIADLDELHSELFRAWRSANQLTTVIAEYIAAQRCD
jgi:hypothetical protein